MEDRRTEGESHGFPWMWPELHTYTHTHLLQPGLNGCQFILAQSESLAFFLSKVTEFSRSSLVFFFFSSGLINQIFPCPSTSLA